MTVYEQWFAASMRKVAETRAIQATNACGTGRALVSEGIDVDSDEVGDSIHPKEMAARIASLIDKVPEEYRDSATIEIVAHDGWYEWIICYNRPETDGEMQQRLDLVRAAAQRQEAEARAQYEALKSKFE